MQGHINLLGIADIIEPISTGGLAGPAASPQHFPPFFTVLHRARQGPP